MNYSSLVFSKKHLLHPFTHNCGYGQTVSIEQKKEEIIALSVLTGVLTLGIGAGPLFYGLTAKYKAREIQTLVDTEIIPNELFIQIFDYAGIDDLIHLTRVSKRFKQVADVVLVDRSVQVFGIESRNNDFKHINTAFVNLLECIKVLASQRWLPKSMIRYHHKLLKNVDVNATLQALMHVQAKDVAYIYGNTPAVSLRGFQYFNWFIAKRGIRFDKNEGMRLSKACLIEAVTSNNTAFVEFWLANGGNTEVKDMHDNTLLMLACKARLEQMVELLLKNKADYKATNSFRESPLFEALAQDNLKILGAFLKSVDKDVNLLNNKNRTLFQTAIESESTAKLLMLLSADIHKAENPLCTAIELCSYEMARVILDFGADTNEGDPLALSVEDAPIEFIQELISRGAQCDAQTTLPFIKAAQFNRIDVMEFLLKKIAVDINELPIFSAENNNPFAIAIENEDVSMVQLMLEFQINLNRPIKNNDCAIHLAAELKDQEILRILLSSGADVNSKGLDGDTALFQCLKDDSYNTFVTLLSYYHADPNIENDEADTPIAWAEKNDKDGKFVRLLSLFTSSE